ncbi:CPBP family intramembrane glutamic endopeptidase [Aliiroseovarius sp. 2305UL8-7]|uniref:CPBP family intramembrane glutamic endopeptidase n=1 Tax=Aliiroseovarius conchicola TaxID=3121637 RepID=UPI003528C68F
MTSFSRSDETSTWFWTPAKPRNQIWRTIVGLILIHAVFLAATFAIFMAGAAVLGSTPERILGASNPGETAVFFLTFLGYHLGLWITLRILHKRGYQSLFGPTLRVSWRHFKQGLMIALVIGVVAVLIDLVGGLFLPANAAVEIEQNLSFGTWLVILLPALGLILMQIFAEELVFRGYLLQQLRARFRSVWLWAIIPSFIFGVLHFDPYTYGINAVFYVTHTTVAGIVLAIVTLRTGNIGAAAGLHFANNAMLLLVGAKGTLDGFSLFLSDLDPKSTTMGWSILLQTGLVVIAFTLWWNRTQRNQPIANASQAD